uniref:Uncharacterized protein n=1 Tax=Pararge aegeria TaxID=116150 RepID=S4PWW4_9NEOP
MSVGWKLATAEASHQKKGIWINMVPCYLIKKANFSFKRARKSSLYHQLDCILQNTLYTCCITYVSVLCSVS